MQKGNIGVTTENIFPVIKKFLYSDHEIFLRELVSNAVDATQKLKTYASKGDFKGELGDITVRVNLDKEAGTCWQLCVRLARISTLIPRWVHGPARSGSSMQIPFGARKMTLTK